MQTINKILSLHWTNLIELDQLNDILNVTEYNMNKFWLGPWIIWQLNILPYSRLFYYAARYHRTTSDIQDDETALIS